MYLSNSSIHNISNVKVLPASVKIILFLGLKFSFVDKPNYRKLLACIEEGKRKIAWRIFFELKGENGEMDRQARILFNIKKSVCPSKLKCPLENNLFEQNFSNSCINFLKRRARPHNKVHTFLVKDLKDFITANKLIIRQSDKNAGICVMNESDYKNEIYRQLSDEQTYRPSAWSEYSLSTDSFRDQAKCICTTILKDKKINRIFPEQSKPAKFYMLPKIHKKFDVFPVGRPISSTINCINRGVSMLLDSILQPLSLNIPDLIIDSPHLILLLSHLKLNPTRKYLLVTADINAMYLELPISTCKSNCMKFFSDNKHKINVPYDVTNQQLKKLLDLALDYSFVQFDNELFFQHRGIQMGNCSSVSVANITAAVELEQQLNKPEITFKGRFIDDLIMIIDTTDLVDIDMQQWLESLFKHQFLKFSFEYSEKCVNFLDMNIMIQENNEICTSLFRKPMSKHEFVHYQSSHPRHLLNSLPFSCGLRIIRICSDVNTREIELNLLMEKFRMRMYPEALLTNTMARLIQLERSELLRPKSPMLIQFLGTHNPSILDTYHIDSVSTTPEKRSFVVIPFYKNINNIGSSVKQFFMSELEKCDSDVLKECIKNVKLTIAFSVPFSFQKTLNRIACEDK